MIKRERLNLDDIVHVMDQKTKNIIRAAVSSIGEEYVNDTVELKCLYFVNKYGEFVDGIVPKYNVNATFDNIYYTPKLAYEAEERKYEVEVNNYCSEMQTVYDLISFPYTHDLRSDDSHKNDAAIEAYRIMCEKLILGEYAKDIPKEPIVNEYRVWCEASGGFYVTVNATSVDEAREKAEEVAKDVASGKYTKFEYTPVHILDTDHNMLWRSEKYDFDY